MEQWIVFGLTIVVLLILSIWKPLWLVPLLVLGVALEISITWYPDLGLLGQMMGLVSLAKLTGFALIFAAFIRVLFADGIRARISAVLKDPLSIMLMIFIAFGAIGFIYSAEPAKTVIETARLLILFAVFVSIAVLMDKEHALIPFKAVHVVAIALAPLAFYEGFTGNLIWQADHLLQEVTLRVNATFIDPKFCCNGQDGGMRKGSSFNSLQMGVITEENGLKRTQACTCDGMILEYGYSSLP